LRAGGKISFGKPAQSILAAMLLSLIRASAIRQNPLCACDPDRATFRFDCQNRLRLVDHFADLELTKSRNFTSLYSDKTVFIKVIKKINTSAKK
jgi:hypothetical protein